MAGDGFKVDPRTLDGWTEGDTDRMGAHFAAMLRGILSEHGGKVAEAEQPREPAGSSRGGQFASTGGSGGGSNPFAAIAAQVNAERSARAKAKPTLSTLKPGKASDPPLNFDSDDPSDYGARSAKFYAYAEHLPQPKLDAEESDILDSYTDGAYHINDSLRGKPDAMVKVWTGASQGYEHLTEVEDVVAGMDRVFAKAKPLPDSITVFRGGRFAADLKPGDVIEDKGFVSTSGASATPVHIFLGGKTNQPNHALAEIVVPKGTRVVVPDMALHREPDDRIEGELILNRGSKFRVVGRRTAQYEFGGAPTAVSVLQLELIP